jgi:hypothetical protein
MPYHVEKKKGGWRVILDHNPSYLFAKKPFKTKRQAIAQMHAIQSSEHGGDADVQGGFVPFLGLAKTVYDMIPIRKNYSSTTKTFLQQYGNHPIDTIVVYRKPIQSFINTTLNIASANQFGRAVKKYGYDKLFHLYLVATVNMGTKKIPILIEKNEIINIKQASDSDLLKENGAFMQVTNPPVPHGLTVNQLLQSTRDKMGDDRYWQYNAFTNNCQVFIKYILDANGMMNQELLDFIMQNAQAIANDSLIQPVQHAVNFTTTLASKLRTLTGRGIMLY